MAEEDRTFSPDQAGQNRNRAQDRGADQSVAAPPEDAETGDAASDEDEAADAGLEPDFRKPLLGEGVPRNVDIHDIGDPDRPTSDWGDPADPGALHSSDHSRRPLKTEAERGQGPKTRQRNKDIVSRR